VEGTKGCRGDRGLYRRQRAVKGTEGHREDIAPWRVQRAVERTQGVEERKGHKVTEGHRGDRVLLRAWRPMGGGVDGCRVVKGCRGPSRRQRAVDGTEGRRGGRAP
jgi:hypothetical protein